jgi:hypothetical protein
MKKQIALAIMGLRALVPCVAVRTALCYAAQSLLTHTTAAGISFCMCPCLSASLQHAHPTVICSGKGEQPN